MPSQPDSPTQRLVGIVLAAGGGTRMGLPKALIRTVDAVPWLELAVAVVRTAGCERVIVVLGAQADEARALVPAGVEIVVAADWADGMSASLRAGLTAAGETNGVDAALITLVDLPGMPAAVAVRVADSLAEMADLGALAQAVYGGSPGHPVLIGREHFHGVISSLSGDRGARTYLVSHGVTEVECGDLFDGHDVDMHTETME